MTHPKTIQNAILHFLSDQLDPQRKFGDVALPAHARPLYAPEVPEYRLLKVVRHRKFKVLQKSNQDDLC